LVAGLAVASSAQAAPVIVGSPLGGPFVKTTMCDPICIAANTALGESGANVTSPVAGTIVRWHVLDASGELRLRVLQPTTPGSGTYNIVSTGAIEEPIDESLQTFSADLPVQAGDLIAINNIAPTAEIGYAGTVGSSLTAFLEGADGEEAEVELAFPGEVAFNVEVEPPPVPMPTPISTPAPVLEAHCVVPNLAGKKLAAAKKKLKAAHCKLGKVTKKKGATSKTGKVGKQSPKAGKILVPGSKVKVTLT
jgi:hypothetical protein